MNAVALWVGLAGAVVALPVFVEIERRVKNDSVSFVLQAGITAAILTVSLW